MPELALPFAIAGAAAGWLLIALVSNPIVALTMPNKRVSGVIVSAIAATLVGLYLTRRCAPANIDGDQPAPEMQPEAIKIRLVYAVICGGGAAGATIGAVAAPNLDRLAYGFGSGAVAGVVGAIVFLPLLGSVLAAARRSVRARLGSIVADVDRRAIISVLAGALGVMTLLGLPDWPFARAGGDAMPRVALAIAAGCAIAVGVCLAGDVVALRRLKAILGGARRMEALDGEEDGVDQTGASGIDLGLGDEVRAEIARREAYRARPRAVAFLRGDARQAMTAVKRAVRRGVLATLAILGAIALHARASAADVELSFDAALCRRNDGVSCQAASRVASLELGRDAVAWGYDDLACDLSMTMSCVAAAERNEAAQSFGVAQKLREQACRLGHANSCEAADRIALRPSEMTRMKALDVVCSGQRVSACLVARVARQRIDESTAQRARNCASGSRTECDEVAQTLSRIDRPAAVLAWLRACDLAPWGSCQFAAEALRDHAIPGAEALSSILAERDCHDHPGVACCQAAYDFEFGADVPKDHARAAKLYDLALRSGFAESLVCRSLPNDFLEH